MATRFILTPNSAEYALSNFPQLTIINFRPVLAFDASTDETCYWTLIAPQGLTFPLTAEVHFIMASDTNTAHLVRFQAAIEAITSGDATDLDTVASFDTVVSGGTTILGTVGYAKKFTLTFTASSDADDLAADDYFRLSLNRDADGSSGTDDATGDCYVLAVELRDSA